MEMTMNNTLKEFVAIFGSQVKAAAELGITDRTFRNYVKCPEKIPTPVARLMDTIILSHQHPKQKTKVEE